MKKILPNTAFYSKKSALAFKSLFLLGFTLLAFTGFAHNVDSYTKTCATGPQYKVQPNVSAVNSSTNYRWQYRNSSNVWVCLVNGANVINGFSYNVTGAVYNQTMLPGQLIFTNPTNGLDNLVLRCIMSDGNGVDPCTLPSGNTFNTGSGSVNHTIDVTNTPCGGSGTASIGDRLWLDADGDGIQDASETTGISGATVQLLNSAGTVIATTTTNSSGNYLFSALAAGNYTVEFPVSASGATLTTKDAGSNDDADSDPSQSTGETGTITLASGQAITNVDAGYSPNNLVLGNKVWYDANNNGLESSENGIANILVRLYKDDNNDNVADGAALVSTITNSSGIYSFANLSPGNYIVGVVIPNGYMSSSVNGGDPDNNTNLDDNGQVLVGNEIRGLAITLVSGTEPENSGRTNNTYDFGLLPDCTCVNSTDNLLINPSFENGTTGWSWNSSNGSLSTGTGYVACGTKNGFNDQTSGTSRVWQDVNVAPGTGVTFSAFAGTHTGGLSCSPTLSLIFLNSSNGVTGQTNVTVTRDVDINNGQLEQYTLTGVAPAGTVKVRVQSSITCNTMKIDAFCLTINCSISLDFVKTDVLCNGASTGSINLTATGGTAPYTYDWADVAGTSNTEDRTGLAAGTYTVTVTDVNGCNKQGSVTITQTTAVVLSTTQVNVLCNGASTGSIDLTVSGGTAPYTYNWGAGQPTTQDRTGLAAGTYNVTVTDANGCSKTTSATITQPANIVLSTTQTNVLCFGASTGSIDLTVTGGVAPYTYNWGAGQPTTQDRTGLAAGTYNVTVTDANGCSKTTSATITQPANIVLSTTQTNVLCFGASTGSIDLTVTGGVAPYTYDWGVGQPTTQDRTGLAAGTYNVTVTDANGCSKTTSATITQAANIVLSTTQTNVLCFGASTGSIDLTVTGGVAPYTYNWGVGQPTTQDRTGLAAGTYNVTVTDANGCSKTTSATITQPANVVLSTTQTNVLCFGASTGSIDLTVTGGVAPYTYNWGAGQPTTQDRTGLAAGTYNVTVTDANGCSKTTSATISQPANIVLSTTQVNVLCFGASTGSIDLTVTGGVAPYMYDWGAGQPTTQDRTGLAAGTYNVTVTDANGCSKTTSATITQPSNIVLSTTQTNVLCFGASTGSIDLTVTGGVAPYTYNWGAGQPTTQDRTGLAAGTYNVTVTDANGCSKTTSATITQPANIVLSTTQTNVLCFGASTGSIDLTVTGGVAPYTYNWGAGQPTTQDRTGLAAGTYNVTVTDANGCSKTTSATITQPANIVLSTTQVNVLCFGGQTGSIDLTVTGGVAPYSYDWGVGQPTTQDRTGLAAGTYNVTVTDANGCSKTTSATITQPANIVLTTTQVNVLCFGGQTGSIDLTVTGGVAPYTYNWGVGQPTTQDRTGLAAGTYNVTVTDANGCSKTTSATITQPSEPSTIGNYVWIDANANGLQDANESPLQGVTVSLFEDANTDGVPDGAAVATDVTDAAGLYLFPNVCPGNYVLQFGQLAGYVRTTQLNLVGNDPTDSDANPATGLTGTINISVNENDLSNDAGYYQAITLGNYVWDDRNNNGIQDAGEPGVSGATVKLYADANGDNIADGPAVATTTTNGSGLYSFSGLTPGKYIVGVTIPAGYNVGTTTATSALPDNDNNTDSNGVTVVGGELRSNFITLTTGGEPAAGVDGDGTNSNQTLDFGLRGQASLGDKVWRDDDKDGVQDAGEPGIAGITVSLYDNNGNLVGATVTDAYGNYLFTNLSTGDYTVRFTLPANYTFAPSTGTSEADATNSDASPVTGTTSTVNLSAGENQRNIDAGMIFNTPPAKANIGDRVWLDTDKDGVQDGGEPGVAGVTVTLYDNTGAIVATAITDANGNYLFTDVAPGAGYTIGFTAPAGTVFSPKDATGDNTDSDADPVTGRTAPFTVVAGVTDLSFDAGVSPQTNNKATLGDRVWNDLNQNGIQDAGEPGLPGVTVRLYAADGTTLLNTTTTDAFGNYIFTDLVPASYVVEFVKPTGYTGSPASAAGSTISNDSDPNPATGKTAPIAVAAGDRNTTVDAGMYLTTPPGTLKLGDRVWNDENRDGVQQTTEGGIAGMTVTLYQNGPDGLPGTSDDVKIGTTSTDVNGSYLFTDLAASTGASTNYNVLFSNIPAGYSFTTQDQTANGGTDNTDSDANVITGRTGSVNLTANNLTLDAGLVQGIPAGKGSIGDRVWYDMPGGTDGVQDPTETGASGITVKLYKDANDDGVISGAELTPVATTITDALGNYMFGGLDAGNYQVGFSGLQAGYTIAAKDAGADDTKDSDGNTLGSSVAGNTATAGTSYTGLFSLTQGEDNLTIDLGIVPPANTNSLGGDVWVDKNNDGVQTPGEPPMKGVMVTLYNSAGTPIATTVTDENGRYLFTGLPDGNYSVGFTNLPAGFSFTNQSVTNDATGSDANVTTGRTTTVTLGPGNRNDTSLDAGLVTQKSAVGNYVWFDANGDGVQDANESGISGVTVTLTRPGFGLDGVPGNADDALPVATAITDANGTYFFSNLEPGIYQAGFSTIPNNLVFTKQNTPGDNQNNTNSDANPSTGLTALFTLSAGETDLTIDAGVAPALPGSVGDYVWNDLNGNGVQDAGEPGVAGVLVTLYDAANNPVGSAITDGNGKYLITNVPAGTGYYVIFSNLPLGGVFTTQTSNVTPADPTFGSDPNPADGRTASFSVVAGQSLNTVDAGIQSNQLTLGNFVWHDLAGTEAGGEGIQNPGELGVSGVTMKLYKDANGDNIPDAAAIATTTTDVNGLYTFTGLTPGKYIVGAVIPAGYTAAATTATSAFPDNDNNIDNNGVTTVAGELRSNFITLVTGGEPLTPVDGDGVNGNLTLDFALKATGSIGDFVWDDINGNGIQDAGEPGIPGVTVTLTYPNGGTTTTTTGANGEYLFINLAPGTYNVGFATPAGTVPSPSNQGADDTKDSDPVAGVASVALAPGQNNTTIDAGFQSNQLSLGNYVWNDINNNGIQEVNEPGIVGVSVKLFADANGDNIPDGAALQTTATVAGGLYNFSGLTPGKYIVGITAPAGYAMAFTTPSSLLPDNDNNTDNNGITIIGVDITSNFITLTTGGEPATGVDGDGTNGNQTLDFGLRGTGSIGDLVWNDLNGNGIQDLGESGIPGVSVTLTYPNGVTLTTTTNGSGEYLFINLAPGTYSVAFTTPGGTVPSPSNQGADDTKDSDPIGGVVGGIILTPGQNNTTIDAGFQSNQLNIGNYVWDDQDNDGIQDAGEPAIVGATVKLYTDANGDNIPDGPAVATTATIAGGLYSFTGLTPGNYIVGVTIPAGYTAGVTTATSALPNNDNNTDNNGVTIGAGELRSNFITITTNGEPAVVADGDGTNGNQTLDFGLKGTGSIGDFVFDDLNGNGIQDAGEIGIPGATVILTYPNGATVSTTTNANGIYTFNNLAPGTYSVTFTTPGGTVPSPANQGGDDTKDSDPVGGVVNGIVLTPGQNNTTIDAGFQSTGLMLGNYVWDDQDNDGVQDAGEPAIVGATVKLYADANGDNTPDGPAVATTATVAGGLYSFSGLTPGKYIVGVTIPAGYTAGTTTATSALPDNDNNTDNNGVTTVAGELRSNFITLTTGGEPGVAADGDGTNSNQTLDFGLKGTGSIGDFVWKDLNSNGIQDAGEPGIVGATVTLTYPNGATISTTTGPNGEYTFSNLAPGNYNVAFTTPDGGYIPSPSNQGGDDTKDSDPVAGAVPVTLAPGQNNITVDAGFIKLINITGNVWHDVNALDDNFVNNTGPLQVPPASVIPTGLRAYLVNASTGLVERVSFVSSSTGVFTFANVTPNTNYVVYLSEQIGSIGNPPPATTLPVGWNHTGQKLGTSAGSDGINDGRLFVPVFSIDVNNVNFGIRLQAGEVVVG